MINNIETLTHNSIVLNKNKKYNIIYHASKFNKHTVCIFLHPWAATKDFSTCFLDIIPKHWLLVSPESFRYGFLENQYNYYNYVVNEIVEIALKFKSKYIVIAGFSLGGLSSVKLYSELHYIHKCIVFSGSFWAAQRKNDPYINDRESSLNQYSLIPKEKDMNTLFGTMDNKKREEYNINSIITKLKQRTSTDIYIYIGENEPKRIIDMNDDFFNRCISHNISCHLNIINNATHDKSIVRDGFIKYLHDEGVS